MITLEKLAIYEMYGGNLDDWTRGAKQHQAIVSGEEMVTIDRLLQELRLVQKNLVSSDYEQRIMEKLRSYAENSAVTERLIEMAKSNQ